MLLKIEQAGQPVLRKAAKPLTRAQIMSEQTQQLIDLMVATLRDRQGVGLAAPQVGEAVQLVIIEDKSSYHKKIPVAVLGAQLRKPVKLHILVNPKLEYIDRDIQNFFEGCLSVDGYRAVVPRAKRVRVTGWNRYGERVTLVTEGWFARILQHEIDHLNGSLYLDRMVAKTFITERCYQNEWFDALPAAINKLLV